MHNQNEELFMTKKKKPSFTEWTVQNGITQKPASTAVGVGVPDDPHSRTNQQVTVKTTTTKPQTRDPFLEGFYSTDDKPETERKTYLQHRTPAVDRVSSETKKPEPIKLPYRPSVQGPPKVTKLPYVPAQDGAPKMTQYRKQTAPAYDSPVKIVGDNVTKKDYDDFWNAFREESTGEKLNWATEQGGKLSKKQKAFDKYYITDDVSKALYLNNKRQQFDEVIRILDNVTAKTRKLKKQFSPYVELMKKINPTSVLNIGNNIYADSLKELHYARNNLNESTPKTIPEAEAMGWGLEENDQCHQVGVPGRTNIKYIPSDGGDGEQIFKVDGTVDTSPENMATPNLFNPQESFAGHFLFDMMPWILWGNSPEDSTTLPERIVMPSLYWIYDKLFESNGDKYDV